MYGWRCAVPSASFLLPFPAEPAPRIHMNHTIKIIEQTGKLDCFLLVEFYAVSKANV